MFQHDDWKIDKWKAVFIILCLLPISALVAGVALNLAVSIAFKFGW